MSDGCLTESAVTKKKYEPFERKVRVAETLNLVLMYMLQIKSAA